MNALTVDVEEWFHVCGAAGIDRRPSDRRLGRNIDKLLSEFDAYRIKATFFVLGSVAEMEPELVPTIAAAGHEIASHGFSHTLVRELTPESFREELRRTGDILERQSGRRPIGFRAPQWSLGRQGTPWAFEILAEEGFRYDSSCNPLSFVGDPGGPRFPFRMTAGGEELWEIPPMVTPSLLGNLPTGGGWGFRFFPSGLIRKSMSRLNEQGFPAVLYLHPREVDPSGPRLRLPLLKAFVTYGPRSDAMERLHPLLRQFRFIPLCRLVEQWESA